MKCFDIIIKYEAFRAGFESPEAAELSLQIMPDVVLSFVFSEVV